MMSASRRLLPLLCLAALLPTLAGCAHRTPVGPAAKDFTLTTLDGKKIRLADLKGKTVLVNFWASWCGYCAEEAPDIEAIYQKYHPEGLEVLGVGDDDAAALAAKASELKLTYPIGSNPEAVKLYGVTGFPTTIVINREGEIVDTLDGARPKIELESTVKAVMETK